MIKIIPLNHIAINHFYAPWSNKEQLSHQSIATINLYQNSLQGKIDYCAQSSSRKKGDQSTWHS
jgi:hypothetical protein